MQSATHLITEFIPNNYQLSLVIDRLGRTFNGTVAIKGRSLNDRVIVHAKGLTINMATIDGTAAEYSYGENDEVSLSTPDLLPGDHTVVITYHGSIIDTQLHGLYPCKFTVDGEQKELIMTQFESHYAREMFPCIDEPEAKATFDITVTTETGVTVLGNMPVIAQHEQDNTLTTTFDTTPRMSTYLVALVIGDMQEKSATTKDGVVVSVWATRAQSANSLDFALEHAVKCIEFYNDYFGVPYPLPKSDNVAVPDFANGAMENWGLVTYRETALLADPATTSISAKEYIATVIAHELSHQWFGNLVTMKWWNNLWLNESFATIMEYIAVDGLHPDWNMWLDFNSSEGGMALRRDAIDGVQSVQIDVNHPDEISTIFDGAIVYAKGARLMNMMRTFVGEAAFRAGLKEYFTTHAYGNTRETDLWDALSKASGKDVAALMNPWISQPGFPVITATTRDGELTLSQQQFFVGSHEASNRQWPIPIDSTYDALPELLTQKLFTATYEDSLVLLNQQNTGHYLTNYDDEIYGHIISAIKDGSLSESQRIQFLTEQTMLARGGYRSMAALIPLLDAYKLESSDKIWDVLSVAIAELKKFVETDEVHEKKLRAFVGSLAQAQFERLGWDATANEPENDIKLRSTILGCILYSENEAALAEAKRRFESAKFDELDPELRPLIASATVRHFETPELINQLLTLYQSSQNAELKIDIASALTSSREKSTLSKLIEQLPDTSIIRPQDTLHWFVYLLANRYSRSMTWSWMRTSWDWITKTFGDDKSFDRFPRYAAGRLASRKQLEEYVEFFTPLRKEISLTRTIDMGIRDLEGRIELVERESPDIFTALDNL